VCGTTDTHTHTHTHTHTDKGIKRRDESNGVFVLFLNAGIYLPGKIIPQNGIFSLSREVSWSFLNTKNVSPLKPPIAS
jgi:hypothetical protein